MLAALLLALPARAAAQSVPTEDLSYPVTLQDGSELELVLRRPADVSRPMPAIVLFGGFQGAARILDYIQTDRAVIRASFRYPWTAPEDVSLLAVPEILRGFGQAVRNTFEGINKLVALLRARPDVDPQRIVIVGASAGAPFATIGGQREDVPAVIIVQGFGELADVIAHQFNLALVPDYGAWLKPLSWLFARFIVWFTDLPQPEVAAGQLQPEQQLLMVTATDDKRIPAAATEALWQAIQASPAQATRMDLEGGHLRGYGDPEITRILSRAMDWMEQADILPAAATTNAE